MDELEKIKRLYERTKERLGTPKEREDFRRQYKRDLDAARKATEKLFKLLPALPVEQIFRLDDEDKPDFKLIDRVHDDLAWLGTSLVSLEIEKSPNVSGWADDQLVANLYRLAEKSGQAEYHKESVASDYEGAFVDYLVNTLPRIDLSAIRAQAFAQRHYKLTH